MTPEEIAASLTKAQREALLEAVPADSREFWLIREVHDRRLAGEDWVLTSLGERVREILQEKVHD